jgi:hypothetical protein
VLVLWALAAGGLADAQVTLNGVTFDAGSARLTNPHLPFAQGDAVAADGFGRKLGCAQTVTAEGVDVILRVNALRLRSEERCPGRPPEVEFSWLAQDTQGNIHALQEQDEDGRRRTVTATQLPSIFLPASPAVGQTFPDRLSSSLAQIKIVSLAASRGGLADLLHLREVEDDNGDGRLDETPGGPDEVEDMFFARGIGVVRFEEVEMGRLGGFARRGVGPRPTLLAPDNMASVGVATEPSVTFRWSPVAGADLHAFEHTGASLTFANPNGAGPDTMNGFGGAGSAFVLPPGTTSLTVTIPRQAPPGAYQWRVIGLTSGGLPVGVFSDAFTIRLAP